MRARRCRTGHREAGGDGKVRVRCGILAASIGSVVGLLDDSALAVGAMNVLEDRASRLEYTCDGLWPRQSPGSITPSQFPAIAQIFHVNQTSFTLLLPFQVPPSVPCKQCPNPNPHLTTTTDRERRGSHHRHAHPLLFPINQLTITNKATRGAPTQEPSSKGMASVSDRSRRARRPRPRVPPVRARQVSSRRRESSTRTRRSRSPGAWIVGEAGACGGTPPSLLTTTESGHLFHAIGR